MRFVACFTAKMRPLMNRRMGVLVSQTRGFASRSRMAVYITPSRLGHPVCVHCEKVRLGRLEVRGGANSWDCEIVAHESAGATFAAPGGRILGLQGKGSGLEPPW